MKEFSIKLAIVGFAAYIASSIMYVISFRKRRVPDMMAASIISIITIIAMGVFFLISAILDNDWASSIVSFLIYAYLAWKEIRNFRDGRKLMKERQELEEKIRKLEEDENNN
jgi:threonine/homoserine/homoserine lactone efflux protein